LVLTSFNSHYNSWNKTKDVFVFIVFIIHGDYDIKSAHGMN